MKQIAVVKKEEVETLHLCVGYACSNSCIFCMEDSYKERYRTVKSFVDSGQIYKMMDDNRNVKKVIFTQGEPTLNPELPAYIKYAKQHGYKEISIISNGRRYKDKKFCLQLIESGATEFIISLHGHAKELHEALTRRESSFFETTQGLKNISDFKNKYPIHIVVSHVVNKVNYKFVKEFLKFMNKFSVDEIVLNTVQPLGDKMKKFFPALMPNYSDLAKTLESALEAPNSWLLQTKGTHKRYVSIIDLPLCLSQKLLPYMGFGETRILNNGKDTVKVTNVPYKSKRIQCSKCLHDGICEGVYDNYIEHFGWDEFKPIVKNNQ